MENKKTLFELPRMLFNAYPGEIGHRVGLNYIIDFKVEHASGVLVPATSLPLRAIRGESEATCPHLVLIDEIGSTKAPDHEQTRLLLMGEMRPRTDTPAGVTKNLIPYAELSVKGTRFSGSIKHEGVQGVKFQIEAIFSKSGYQSITIDDNLKSQVMFTHYLRLTRLAFEYANNLENEWVTGVFAPKDKGYNDWVPTHVNFKELTLAEH